MNKERLLQLAAHLEVGLLGHAVFNFSVYNGNGNSPLLGLADERLKSCGTNGCAIGECPIIWPEAWHFGVRGVTLALESDKDTEEGGCHWFGLSINQYEHLFAPYSQEPFTYGGEFLDGNATKEEVASNIRSFVVKMEEA